MITAKEMYENAKEHGACDEVLDCLESLPEDADPLLFEHENKAKLAYWYAKHIIKGRWPEAEPIILTDPYTAYSYTESVIKKRFPEAEPIILTKPHTAYMYAKDVIKRCWPEAEQIIATDPRWAGLYSKYVVNK